MSRDESPGFFFKKVCHHFKKKISSTKENIENQRYFVKEP